MIRILKLLTAGSLHANQWINYFLIDASRPRNSKNGYLINNTSEMIQKRGSSWRESSSVNLPISGLLYARYKWWTRSGKACMWHVVKTYGVYDCDEVKQRLWDADRQAGYSRTNRQHNTDVRNIFNAFSINAKLYS